MKYSPHQKLPAQQLNWAQIWVNSLIEHNEWTLVKLVPVGYYVYHYVDDE
ncbi:hypothetical protein [Psychrobacter coccoides]|nr:hypothetical protein [Psychrobacter coccoides]